MSNFFSINRGVRQGDPLSPYLYLIAIECLSAHIKLSTEIQGIEINGSEYVISQYADDSVLFLDGSVNSLQAAINCLDLFENTAGQRANKDKTLGIWIGSKIFSSEKLLPEQNLSWSHRTFKLLGINFDLNKSDITALNYTQKLESIKNLLSSWVFRPLSLLGKITVIKSLALSILVHLFMVLPDPSPEWITELENIFFKFIWDRGKDKVKRNVMYGAYDEGGLRVPHIPSFIKSLKLIWIKKFINPLDYSPWKLLAIDQLNIGNYNIWNSSSKHLNWIANNKISNPFWKDVLLAWSRLKSNQPSKPAKVLSQGLWYNPEILIENKPVYYKGWAESDILYINDLVDNNGNIYSYENFQDMAQHTNKYITSNFLKYYGLISAIPQIWKTILKQNPLKLNEINDCNDMILLKHNFKPSKIFYLKYINQIVTPPTSQKRWLEHFDIDTHEWKKYYALPYKTTNHSKLLNLQFKISHRILATNKKLKLFGIKDSDICDFCNIEVETISHLFWECKVTKIFLNTIFAKLEESCALTIAGSEKVIIFGLLPFSDNIAINNFLLITKCYIYKKSHQMSPLYPNEFKRFLENYYDTEILYLPSEKLVKKWIPVLNYFK